MAEVHGAYYGVPGLLLGPDGLRIARARGHRSLALLPSVEFRQMEVRLLPMKTAAGTASKDQLGFHSAMPPKRSSALRNNAGS
ncbi:hypothetical protein A5648_05850 [Mycolicibacter sinensis]|uniref:Uncharacterized protein n=1 Tax=Mycolicibacter sinensis (strain JDM601) TaxID=875328 RepID=A0A1A3TUM7_MYCSD|nr:hypothetical protein A5648_05850 [Mycolicibacter sinensis]